ncbi:MAG: hypothetical protein KAR07_10700 [Spirochaetes bacterium]|nr:hypothetical protein [Spirochaetota bacterium]
MKNDLIVNVLRLSRSKKGALQKISYFLRGVIFFPFLVYEEQKQKKKGGNASEAGQTGDDVYPLF